MTQSPCLTVPPQVVKQQVCLACSYGSSVPRTIQFVAKFQAFGIHRAGFGVSVIRLPPFGYSFSTCWLVRALHRIFGSLIAKIVLICSAVSVIYVINCIKVCEYSIFLGSNSAFSSGSINAKKCVDNFGILFLSFVE